MLLATWNVNSLRARLPRVLEFLDVHAPDVLLLQETKATSDQIPAAAFADHGYAIAEHSAGRWAGVAIVSRSSLPPTDVLRGLDKVRSTAPDPPGAQSLLDLDPPAEARWIEADVGGLRLVSVYVPNGRALDDPAYLDKLAFLDAMIERVASLPRPLVLGGDLNIARTDADVYDPARFVNSTHTSAPERERLERLLAGGPGGARLVDAYRHLESEEPGFTWWDYRAGHFHRRLGMRIDYFLVSEDLAPSIRRCGTDREFRKGPRPSDHAPLLLELAL